MPEILFQPVIRSVKRTDDSSSTYTEQSGQTSDGRIIVLKTLSDDGRGGFVGEMGSVNYVGKQVSARLVELNKSTSSYQSDSTDAKSFEQQTNDGSAGSSGGTNAKGGKYSTTAVGEEVLAAVEAKYRTGAGAPVHKVQTYTPPAVVLDLCPYTTDQIIPGSVMFVWMGTEYVDAGGEIFRGRTSTDAGVACGTIDYAAGTVTMYDYVVGGTGPKDFVLLSLWTKKTPWTTASLFFNTPLAPLRAGAGSFVLSLTDTKGTKLTANVDGLGNITGQHMRGKIEFARGGVDLLFGDYVLDADLTPEQKREWWYNADDVGAVQPGKIWRPWPVDPTTLTYSAVGTTYLPVDVSLMGLDPAALPSDGRVPFARPGDTCVIGLNIKDGPAFAPVIGDVYSLGHERLSFVQVLNAATGAEIRKGYSANLDAGTVTFSDLTDYPAQVRIIGRVEVRKEISEVRIDGRVRLTQPIGYAFEPGAVFSTCLEQNDRFARVERVYDQKIWDGVNWIDGLSGDQAPANYDTKNNKMIVTNRGAITERWACKFRSDGTTFDFYGQHLGVIAWGTIHEDFSPMNNAAGAPYITIKAAGWGGGWGPNNTLFIDTIGADFPIAVVRCTQPGSPAGIDDSFWLVQRGDVDRDPGTTF